jgi:hypothetical protein
MSTEDYLKQICSATANEAKMGLALVLMNRYERESDGKPISEDEVAALVAGVVNCVFGEDASNDYQRNNADKIAAYGHELANDEELCLVLSGAAYNMAYARYLIAGGSRGMFSNDFLTARGASPGSFSGLCWSIHRDRS